MAKSDRDRRRRIIARVREAGSVNKRQERRLTNLGVSDRRIQKLSSGSNRAEQERPRGSNRAEAADRSKSYTKARNQGKQLKSFYNSSGKGVERHDLYGVRTMRGMPKTDRSGTSAYFDPNSVTGKGTGNTTARSFFRGGTDKRERKSYLRAAQLGERIQQRLLSGRDTGVFKGKSFSSAAEANKRLRSLSESGKDNYRIAVQADPGARLNTTVDRTADGGYITNSNMSGAYGARRSDASKEVANIYNNIQGARFYLVNKGKTSAGGKRKGGGGSAAGGEGGSRSTGGSSAGGGSGTGSTVGGTSAALQQFPAPQPGSRFGGGTPGVTRAGDFEVSTLNPRVGDTTPVNPKTNQLNSSSVQLTRRISPITGMYESNEADYSDNPYSRDWIGDDYSQGLNASAAMADQWRSQNIAGQSAMEARAAAAPAEYQRIVAAAKPTTAPPKDLDWQNMFQKFNRFL